ncbi:MAG: hypothetical protein V5B38_03135 [Candidatus Accumulibacter propinquus]|jgi:hypothetical protein
MTCASRLPAAGLSEKRSVHVNAGREDDQDSPRDDRRRLGDT